MTPGTWALTPPAGAAIGVGRGRCRLSTIFLILAQFGLCPTGLWLALDDKATVKVCGASEKTFRVELPVGPK